MGKTVCGDSEHMVQSHIQFTDNTVPVCWDHVKGIHLQYCGSEFVHIWDAFWAYWHRPLENGSPVTKSRDTLDKRRWGMGRRNKRSTLWGAQSRLRWNWPCISSWMATRGSYLLDPKCIQALDDRPTKNYDPVQHYCRDSCAIRDKGFGGCCVRWWWFETVPIFYLFHQSPLNWNNHKGFPGGCV